MKRPFFAHVKTLEGTQVTRNFPPQEGDPDDHQWMHPGIWMAFAVLNQQSFWHNRDGRVIQEQLTNVRQGDSASWECVDRFENGKGDIVCPRENALPGATQFRRLDLGHADSVFFNATNGVRREGGNGVGAYA